MAATCIPIEKAEFDTDMTREELQKWGKVRVKRMNRDRVAKAANTRPTTPEEAVIHLGALRVHEKLTGNDVFAVARQIGHRVRAMMGATTEEWREEAQAFYGKNSLADMNPREVYELFRVMRIEGMFDDMSPGQRRKAAVQLKHLRHLAVNFEIAGKEVREASAKQAKKRDKQFVENLRPSKKHKKPEPDVEEIEGDAVPLHGVPEIRAPGLLDWFRSTENRMQKWETGNRLLSKIFKPIQNLRSQLRNEAEALVKDMADTAGMLSKSKGLRLNKTNVKRLYDLLEANHDELFIRGRDGKLAINENYISKTGELSEHDPLVDMARWFRSAYNDLYLRTRIWDTKDDFVGVELFRDGARFEDYVLKEHGLDPKYEHVAMPWHEFSKTKLGQEVLPLAIGKFRSGYQPHVADFEKLDNQIIEKVFGGMSEAQIQAALGREYTPDQRRKFIEQMRNFSKQRRDIELRDDLLEDPFTLLNSYADRGYRAKMSPLMKKSHETLRGTLFDKKGKPLSQRHRMVYNEFVKWSEHIAGIPSATEVKTAYAMERISEKLSGLVKILPGGEHIQLGLKRHFTPSILRQVVNAGYVGMLGARVDLPVRNIATQGPAIFSLIGEKHTFKGFMEFMSIVNEAPQHDKSMSALKAFYQTLRSGDPALQKLGVTSQSARTDVLMQKTGAQGLGARITDWAQHMMALFDTSEVALRSSAYLGARSRFLEAIKDPAQFKKLQSIFREVDHNRINDILDGRLDLAKEASLGSDLRLTLSQYTKVDQAAHEFAKSVVSRTQFVYSPENSPMITWSSVGRMGFQFQSYGVNVMDFYADLIRGASGDFVSAYKGESRGFEQAKAAGRLLLWSYVMMYGAGELLNMGSDDEREAELAKQRLRDDYFFGPMESMVSGRGVPLGPSLSMMADISAAMFATGGALVMSPVDYARTGEIRLDPVTKRWLRVDKNLTNYMPAGVAYRRYVLPEDHKGAITGLAALLSGESK